MNIKIMVKNLASKKHKGGLTFLEMLVIAALIILVGYGLYSDFFTTIFTQIQAWFTGANGLQKIFK